MIKSPIKWAGGKQSLVPFLLRVWRLVSTKGINRYVDLFGGSCVIPLNIQPNQCIINDANKHLIDFWRWLQRDGLITRELINNEHEFLRLRDEFNKSPSPEIFYYLNKLCFNGLYRENKSGKFNVGYCKDPNRSLITDLSEYTHIIKGWEFVNMGFAECIDELDDEKSLVFADPPYHNAFTSYTSNGFDWNQQVLLANKLKSLSDKGNIVIATNNNTPEIVDLYSSLGFSIYFISMPRKISCDGDRKPAKEILAIRKKHEFI